MDLHKPDLEIDLENFQVRKSGHLIRLTQTEWALLRVLIQHKNQPVSQKVLLKELWHGEYGINSNHLYNCIASLREKLGDNSKNPKYLITLPKIGYQWVEHADVREPSYISPAGKQTLHAVIPIPFNAFIGRDRELAILERKLRKKDVRLLTVTGPGGIGKTRLVLEMASRLESSHPFVDGMHFIDLAPVDTPDFVVSAIAHAFGLREKAAEAPLSALKNYLRDKNLLLILDNFEHVTAATEQLLEILTVSRDIKILITSRERLRLYGEHHFELPPLPLSTSIQSETGSINEAVLLYVDRAQTIDPYFELTPENAPILQRICERLDALPLAIELAASASDRYTPSALLEQLDSRLNVLVDGQRNLPPRHQTLRAAIDWSYDLLDSHESQLFRSLSVFAGSFSADAVAVVCTTQALSAAHISEKLAALRHKSLLSIRQDGKADEARYSMLGVLREYATDRLTKGQADALSRRHADYYLNLLETHNLCPDEDTHNRLSSNLDNLRAAMQWAMTNHAGEVVLRISVGLYDLWWRTGRLREGKQWLFDALDVAADCPTPLRAQALYCAGALADWLGEHQIAQSQYRESLRLYETLEDVPGITHALLILASALINQGDFVEGQSLSEQSLGMAHEQDDLVGVERALNNLGMIAIYQGNALKARSIYDEMLSRCESRNNAQSKAWALTGLSWTTLLEGDYLAAQRCIAESLLLHQQSIDILGTALALTCDSWIALYRADFDEAMTKMQVSLMMCQNVGLVNLSVWPLTGLARIHLHRGDLWQARYLLDEALRLCRELNFPPITAWVYLALGIEQRMNREYEAAFDDLDRALTLSQKRDDKNALIAVLEQFATLFVAQDQPDLAVQLFSASSQMRETNMLPLSTLDRIEYDLLTTQLQCGRRPSWDIYWRTGRTLNWDGILHLIYHGHQRFE